MVVWIDDFLNDEKSVGCTRIERNFGLAISGVRGTFATESIYKRCYMESDPEIDSCFTRQVTVGTGSTIGYSNAVQPSQGKGTMLFVLADETGGTDGECQAAIRFVNGSTDYIGGWHQIVAKIDLLVSNTVTANDTKAFLYAYFISPEDVGESSQTIYRYAVGVDTTVDADEFVCIKSTDGITETWATTGIDLPSEENRWVTLSIYYDGITVRYVVEVEDNDPVTAGPRPKHEGLQAGVEVGAHAINSRSGSSFKSVYWDMFAWWTSMEYVDDAEYPDHKHFFYTTDIENASSYNSIKITPVIYKDAVEGYPGYQENQSVTWTVYNAATDTAITGFTDRTELNADLKNIDVGDNPSIYIKIMLSSDLLIQWIRRYYQLEMHAYFRFAIDKIEINYNAIDERLTLSCTYNSYNSDITPPIETKTGYMLKFSLSVLDYYYGNTRGEDDEDIPPVYYWFDFGDGTNSGWINKNEVSHTFTKHTLNWQDAGPDLEWNVRARVMWFNGEISDWSNFIDVSVLNEAPVAMLLTRPKRVRMSGVGIATIKFYGHESYDIDDNGFIYTSGGYKFDFGDGSPESWQTPAYATHQYTSAGLYNVGLTVRDDKQVESEKITLQIRILPPLTATLLSFNMRPREIGDNYAFGYEIYHTVSGGYEEVEPDYTMKRTLTVQCQAHNSEDDLQMLLGLAETHTPIAMQYYKIGGDIATFVGYITSIKTNRVGGLKYDVPISMTLQYLKDLTPGDDTLVGIMKYDEGDTLPSASSEYVNTYFRKTSSGVKDEGYLCVKRSTGVYEWIKIVEGTV